MICIIDNSENRSEWKHFIVFLKKRFVQCCPWKKHTDDCFTAVVTRNKDHNGIQVCWTGGHSGPEGEPPAVRTQQQVTVSAPAWIQTSSDAAPLHRRSFTLEASSVFCTFHWRSEEKKGQTAFISYDKRSCMCDYRTWWANEHTFRLLSLTTSSTFSSDCISFNWRRGRKKMRWDI